MKKLIAAAVATSVSAIAMADISITGQLKTNFTHTDYQSTSVNDSDAFTSEGDLYIKGKSGDTSIVMNIGGLDSTAAQGSAGGDGTIAIEDSYLTTKIGDVNVKMGNYDNGNNTLRASDRNSRASLSTSIGGFTLGYLNGNGGDSQNDEVTIGTELGGVAVSYTAKDGGESIKASTSMSGVNVSYLGLPSDSASSDRQYIEVATTLGGVGVKLGKAEAETSATIEGDSWMGDYEGASGAYDLTAGQDVTAVELSTSMAGNKVVFRNVNIDDVASSDTSFNKVIVTRPLASGTTLEVTYTDLDDDGSTTTDSETLDIELAVKF
jgi:hypothetical protein